MITMADRVTMQGYKIRATIVCEGGQKAESLTLRGLRDRLTEIIEENERRYPERNDHPVVLCIPQPKTPSGRVRETLYYPLNYASAVMLGFGGMMHNRGTAPLYAGDLLWPPKKGRSLDAATWAVGTIVDGKEWDGRAWVPVAER